MTFEGAMSDESIQIFLKYIKSLSAFNPQWRDSVVSQDFIRQSNNKILTYPENINANRESAVGDELNNAADVAGRKTADQGILTCNVGTNSGIFPLAIIKNNELGRHIVSSRVIKAGEVVLIEPPVVLAPLVISPLEKSKSYCVQCFKEVCSYTCEQCGMFLCGEQCENGNIHSRICLLFQRLNLSVDQQPIHRLRSVNFQNKIEDWPMEDKVSAQKMLEDAIVSLIKSQRLKILRCYPMMATLMTLLKTDEDKLMKETILSLQDSVDTKAKQYRVNTQRIVNPIVNELKLAYSSELVNRVASIWDTNGFEVMVSNDSKCQGLYPASSLLTHSCYPNCQHCFSLSGVMVIRALEDVKPDTILTICYTDQLWPTHVRVDHLQKTKNFTCMCKRCVDPTELGTFVGSILCPCQGYLISKPDDDPKSLRCSKCSMEHNKKESLAKEANATRDLSSVNTSSIQEISDAMDKLSSVLHPNHHLILRLEIDFLNEMKKLDVKDFDDARLDTVLMWMERLYSTLTKLLPKYSRKKAHVFKRLAQLTKEKRARTGSEKDEVPQDELYETQLVLGWEDQSL